MKLYYSGLTMGTALVPSIKYTCRGKKDDIQLQKRTSQTRPNHHCRRYPSALSRKFYKLNFIKSHCHQVSILWKYLPPIFYITKHRCVFFAPHCISLRSVVLESKRKKIPIYAASGDEKALTCKRGPVPTQSRQSGIGHLAARLSKKQLS